MKRVTKIVALDDATRIDVSIKIETDKLLTKDELDSMVRALEDSIVVEAIRDLPYFTANLRDIHIGRGR